MLIVGYICAFVGAFYAGFEIWRAWNPLVAIAVVFMCLALTLFVPVVGFALAIVGSVAATKLAWTRKFEEIATEEDLKKGELDQILDDLE
ncbi:MAG: hypothetical protein ACQEVA_06925 [Myxococcota bacterium]